MKKALDRDDAAWEAELAAAWKASGTDAAGDAEESAALALRLDGILRAERALRKARRMRAWLAWGAAAACAAAVALATARVVKTGEGEGTAVVAAATVEESEDESDVAAARVAPVSEAFGELEEVLTELAALDFGYRWTDEDLEMAD